VAEPQVQYCTSFDSTSIAYAMHPGPDRVPVLQVPSLALSHAQMEWSLPFYRAWYEALTAERPVIRYDHRGAGLSDHSPEDTSLDAHVADAIAVLDALGLERVHVFGASAGSMLAIALASKAPSRVLSLALWMAMLRFRAGNPAIDAALNTIAEEDLDFFFRINAGAMAGWGRSADDQDAIFRFSKASVTRDDYLRQRAAWRTYDVADSATIVRSPTLVAVPAQNTGGIRPALGPAREVVKAIPGARLLPCADAPSRFFSITDDAERAFIAFMQEHETEGKPAAITTPPSEAPATVRTILFTDIVGHTEMMQRLGDAKGRNVLREHERITRETLKQHGGAEVKTDGDSFMASFASVSAAVECAIELQRAFAHHTEAGGEPIVVRMGLNVGEPIEEEGDFFGSAVILGARIKDQAGGGEILVPEAVRHMLSGKSFVFSDRGEFALKGFDDAVRLYEVQWRE
jgi:class 3 adenylate cyclase